ncbi:hypothetical protein MRX96_002289 [Rhipicephalus microplus]
MESRNSKLSSTRPRAPHHKHRKTWPRGRRCRGAGEAEFMLLINPALSSRIGTSVARDTNPDLNFAMLREGGTTK